jgi:formate dehydrogenase major subunit
VLDPFGKIPEFKYCAVKVTAGGEVPDRMSFGGGSILADAMSANQ